ncbi:putative adipose-regulatory protein-domain-containing protein, partial [Sphaerosporella brunnea]
EEEEEGGGGGAMMLLRERRPGALTYRTPLLVTLHTLVTAPLLLLGVTRQEETLHIVLTESAVFAHTPRSATVAVDAGLSLYSATLDFSAQLAGLRWVMFRWRVASFVVGTGMFWGVEVAGMLAAWWWASGYLARKKQEVQQQVLGKEQVADDVVQFSDAQRTFPSRAGEAYPTPEPEGGEVGDDEESTETEAEAEAAVLRDSGIGTESTERERMGSVRRRSRGAGSSAR